MPSSHAPHAMLRIVAFTLLATALRHTLASAQLAQPAPNEQCAAPPSDTPAAAVWLARAAARVLPATLDGRVLRYRAWQDRPLWDQSTRPFEPVVPNMWVETHWLDLATLVEGVQPPDRPIAAGRPPFQMYGLARDAFLRDTILYVTDSSARPSPFTRLNPWTVLLDWRARAGAARVVARCVVREYPRIVLESAGERLYVSESDATPLQLTRVEPHYLWGQVRADYQWMSWAPVTGGGLFPEATFHSVDGTLYERLRTTGPMVAIPRDSAPPLTINRDAPNAAADPLTARFSRVVPDTVRAGGQTFLLVTPRYTEAVTLQRDTVFLLDATTSESRAVADSAWIARLFPGQHAVTVVVSDAAWLHNAGVRFWVARGATIVAPRGAETLIRRVVDRRWSVTPDALERSRRPLRLRPVSDSLRLAGGAVIVHALAGSSTEAALGTWVPAERFFWAGEYVQGSPDSPATRDVVSTLRSLGIRPDVLGAQHVKLTRWETLDTQFPRQSGSGAP